MKAALLMLFAAGLFLAAQPSHATHDEFCDGFDEGYKSVKGDLVALPMCPATPTTPIGSTDFREGLKAGMVAGQLE